MNITSISLNEGQIVIDGDKKKPTKEAIIEVLKKKPGARYIKTKAEWDKNALLVQRFLRNPNQPDPKQQLRKLFGALESDKFGDQLVSFLVSNSSFLATGLVYKTIGSQGFYIDTLTVDEFKIVIASLLDGLGSNSDYDTLNKQQALEKYCSENIQGGGKGLVQRILTLIGDTA